MNWYKAESTVMPPETDTTSSKVYNYVRRNITEKEVTNNDTTITVYEYEEMKISKDFWGVYLSMVQNAANIDYIAMEQGIDLEE